MILGKLAICILKKETLMHVEQAFLPDNPSSQALDLMILDHSLGSDSGPDFSLSSGCFILSLAFTLDLALYLNVPLKMGSNLQFLTHLLWVRIHTGTWCSHGLDGLDLNRCCVRFCPKDNWYCSMGRVSVWFHPPRWYSVSGFTTEMGMWAGRQTYFQVLYNFINIRYFGRQP